MSTLCGLLLKALSFHSSLFTLPTQNAGKPLPPSTCKRITLTDKKANSHITEEKEPWPATIWGHLSKLLFQGGPYKVFQPHLQGTLLVLFPDHFLPQRRNICERPIPFSFCLHECWWANQVVLHKWRNTCGNNGDQKSWVISMQETRLHRTETRSWEGCQELHEWSGCVWELDNQLWKVGMLIRLLQSLSVTDRFSFQIFFLGTSKEDNLHN